MSDKNNLTYLERLQNRFKNNPFIAWLIVAASLILAVSALIPATKNIVSELDTSVKEPPLNITLEAF